MPWPRRIDNELVSAGFSRSWGRSIRDMAEFLDDMQGAPIPKYQKRKAEQLRKRLEGYITHVKLKEKPNA